MEGNGSAASAVVPLGVLCNIDCEVDLDRLIPTELIEPTWDAAAPQSDSTDLFQHW